MPVVICKLIIPNSESSVVNCLNFIITDVCYKSTSVILLISDMCSRETSVQNLQTLVTYRSLCLDLLQTRLYCSSILSRPSDLLQTRVCQSTPLVRYYRRVLITCLWDESIFAQFLHSVIEEILREHLHSIYS